MSNANLKNENPSLLKTTKDDGIKELNYKTEKHDLETILMSLKFDNNNYKKSIKV